MLHRRIGTIVQAVHTLYWRIELDPAAPRNSPPGRGGMSGRAAGRPCEIGLTQQFQPSFLHEAVAVAALLKDDVVSLSKLFRSLRTVLAVAAVACLALAGCTQSPAKHDERLTKAAGVARVTIVCSKDLWNETKPDGVNVSNGPENTAKATVSAVSTGPCANRGSWR